MQLKVHILIAVLIMLGVLGGGWFAMQTASLSSQAAIIKRENVRQITIAHADWGRNCEGISDALPTYIPHAQPTGSFADAAGTGLAPDNVLQQVAAACDGKLRCTLTNSPTVFGFNPAPGCEKRLIAEYRCSLYDRPWKLDIAPGQSGVIECGNAISR